MGTAIPGRRFHRETLPGGYTLTWYQTGKGALIRLLERNGRDVIPERAPHAIKHRLMSLDSALDGFFHGVGEWPRAEDLQNAEPGG